MPKLSNNSVDNRWTYYLSCASAANLAERAAIGTNLTYFDGYAIPNGTSSELKLPNYTGLLRVSTLHLIIDYKTKFHCFLANGITITITGTTLNVGGITSPSVYVNGNIISNNALGNISTGLKIITITTTTKFNITNGNLFKNSTNFGDSSIALFAVSPYTLTRDEIQLLHNGGLYKDLSFPILENKSKCCFTGNNSAYLEAPIDSRFSFTDGVNDKPFWLTFSTSFNVYQDAYPIVVKMGASSKCEWGVYVSPVSNYILLGISNPSVSAYIERRYPLYSNVTYSIGYTAASKTVNDIYCFANGLPITKISDIIVGTYAGQVAQNTPLQIGNSANYIIRGLISNNINFVKIGNGILSNQNAIDLFNGLNIGTEIEHWPLSESGGNIRYGVLNGINLQLKATTDGNYNVGYQDVYDSDSQVGGCTKVYYTPSALYTTEAARYPYRTATPMLSGSTWTVSVRVTGLVIGAGVQEFIFLGLNFSASTNNGTTPMAFNVGGTGYSFNGTGNTVNAVAKDIFITPNEYTIIIKKNNFDYYLNINGISYGYITAAANTAQIDKLKYISPSANSSSTYYDLRAFENTVLTDAECLQQHNNTLAIIPTHAYHLLGDTPNLDLIGSLNLINDIDLPSYTIPNKANNTCILKTYQPVTPSNPIQIRRGVISEVFKLKLQGSITDKYGKTITVNGNCPIINDVQKAVYFNGLSNYLDCGNILNTEMKDGFIIKVWSKMTGNFNHDTTGAGIISKFANMLGFYTVDVHSFVDGSIAAAGAKIPSPLSKKGLYNVPCLTIFQIYKEKSRVFVFTDELKGSYQVEKNIYIHDTTQSLIIGKGLASSANEQFVGLIYDLSISVGGVLTLQEAYQIWASEKNKYLI